MKILITGKKGYIARSLANNLENHSITLVSREDFDLSDRESTNKFFKDKFFDIVIHTAIAGGSRLKQDSNETLNQNLSMFYNLLANQDRFNKCISFGSGAELGIPTSPYGLSKNVIHRIIQNEPKFYNIRIFGVFDENELDTRFIKSNIIRYINNEPMVIHENKLMDFFYMKDLVTLVDKYINHNNLSKLSECTYEHKYSLLDIAGIINSLSKHKVPIEKFAKLNGVDYIGTRLPDIPLIGLEEGIKQTYKKIIHNYE